MKARATTRHSSLELRRWIDKYFIKLARICFFLFLFFVIFMFCFVFSISNCFTHFYMQQDNIKKLTKKTFKNKQQHKNKTLSRLKMTKAKQRQKNPDNIEKVYIQLRFPDNSQLNKIKREENKTLWKQNGNLKT